MSLLYISKENSFRAEGIQTLCPGRSKFLTETFKGIVPFAVANKNKQHLVYVQDDPHLAMHFKNQHLISEDPL